MSFWIDLDTCMRQSRIYKYAYLAIYWYRYLNDWLFDWVVELTEIEKQKGALGENYTHVSPCGHPRTNSSQHVWFYQWFCCEIADSRPTHHALTTVTALGKPNWRLHSMIPFRNRSLSLNLITRLEGVPCALRFEFLHNANYGQNKGYFTKISYWGASLSYT